MKRIVTWALPAALLCGLGAAPAAAADRDPPAAPKERLTPVGTWLGYVGAVEKDRTSFTLVVPIRIPFWEVRQVSPDHLRITSGVYSRTERVTVWLPADTKIRLPAKPQFDAQGHPVRGPTAADPNDTDRRLGGARGTPADLRARQVVQVTLERNRAGHLFARAVIVHGDGQ